MRRQRLEPPNDQREAPELHAEVELISTERLIFFSDAVVAIAITLLALALPLPTGLTNAEVLASARDHGDEYLAFLLSFIVIAAHWRGHHRVFRYVYSVDHLIRANLVWLLSIVVTPFATRVLTGDNAFQTRFVFYAAVQAIAGMSFGVMLWMIDRYGQLRAGSPPRLVRESAVQVLGFTLMFLVSIPISFATHWAYLCWVAIPLSTRLIGRLVERYVPSDQRTAPA